MSDVLRQSNTLRNNLVLSLEDVGLDGELSIPEGARSIVMFVSGNNSDRCNRFVAQELNKIGIATLLFDLMTPKEEATEHNTLLRMNFESLARRVMDATKLLSENSSTRSLRLGYFASGEAGAAAFVAAARLPRHVHAIVSCDGSPDLAGNVLSLVKAPTILIVAGEDVDVLRHNRQSTKHLKCEFDLEVLPGLPDLSEREGEAPAKVAEIACAWFKWYLNKNGQ